MMYAAYQALYAPGTWWSFTRVFQYITFRTAAAALISGTLCWLLSRFLIPRFRRWEIYQSEPREELDFQRDKTGTPTMGGVLIVGAVALTTLLCSDLTNRFVHMTLFVLVSLGLLGGLDDWVQVRYPDSGGLRARTKFGVQGLVALIVGLWLIQQAVPLRLLWVSEEYRYGLSKSLFLPFLKSVWVPLGSLYVPFVMLVIVGGSNAVNLTDGLDGLAVGCVVFVAVAYGAMSYVSGHYVFSEYLQVPNIRGTGELTPFAAAIIGAGLGFLWYNAFPAQIFMGDAGALPLGGVLGTIAVLIKQEILLVLVGGIFVAEALSVVLQVVSYRLTGRRLFRMAPLHHHFELGGINESKITVRFWLIGITLAMLALSTLKLR